MKHVGALFFMLMAVWLLWSGHYTPLLLGLGLFSCLFVLLTARRMGVVDHESAPVEVTGRMLVYFPWLVWQIVRSNVDVARRVLRPRMTIRPHLVRIRPGQRTDLGRVIHANSITLTPGTVTVAAGDDEFTIHALSDEAAAGVRDGEMDRRVCGVEGRP